MSTGRLGAGDTAIQPTIFDAKADILTATAADTPARLAVGSNGQYLKADSTTATGLAWATLPSSGKVLQVVQGSTTTETGNTSTTYADTTLSASITPSATSSKILVIVSQNATSRNSSAGESIIDIRIVRGSTTILTSNRFNQAVGSTGLWLTTTGSLVYLDSPNTTSSTTYKTQQALGAVGTNTYTQYQSSPSYITLIEIGA